MLATTTVNTAFLFALSLPFWVILVTMIGFRWSAFRAGLLAFTITLLGTPWLLEIELGWLLTNLLPGSLLEALGTSLSILWIIVAALCIYYAQLASGAIEQIQRQLSRLHSDPRVSALLIAWFFSLFMEGAAGFGTSAALTAPFLVAAGYRPVIAVVLALWGHSMGVTFGAVGTPVISQAWLVAMPELTLGQAVIPYLIATTGVLAMGLSWALVRFAPLNASTPWPAIPWRTSLLLGLLAGFGFLLPAIATAWYLGPELPTLVGALVGAILFVLLAPHVLATHKPDNTENNTSNMPFLAALAPYLVLVLLVLVTRLVPEIKAGLQALQWQVQWDNYQFSFQYLYHPGTMLMLSFVIGIGIQWLSTRRAQPHSATTMDAQPFQHRLRHAVAQALTRALTVLPALVIMLLLSRLLVHNQAIVQLGQQVVAVTGATWPFWAPWFGVLGTFITGSATSSNILFSEFQRSAATSAQVPYTPLLGAQTFGAAIGNMICPHNIIAAGATVNIQGEEGHVLRYTLPMALMLSVIAGGVAIWLVY